MDIIGVDDLNFNEEVENHYKNLDKYFKSDIAKNLASCQEAFENKDYIEDGGVSMVDEDDKLLFEMMENEKNFILPRVKSNITKELEDLIVELDLIAKKYLGDNVDFTAFDLNAINFNIENPDIKITITYKIHLKKSIKHYNSDFITVFCKNIDNIKEFTELLLKDLLFDK